MEKNNKRLLLRLVFIFFLASCSLLAPSFVPIELSSAVPSNLYPSSPLSLIEPKRKILETENISSSPIKKTPPFKCYTVKRNSICCDRNAHLSDVCVLKGNVSADPSSSSISLSLENPKNILETINDLNISTRTEHRCDIIYKVPAIVFSTFNGDISREFNEALIPLFITSRRYHRKVVFLVQNYHPLWRAKYRQVLSRLSAYPPVDFYGDNRTRCFPEVTIGLRMHGEFSINPKISKPGNMSIVDFQELLFHAYGPRIRYLETKKSRTEENEAISAPLAPKLLMLSEKNVKVIDNQKELNELCEDMGFKVEVLTIDGSTDISTLYLALNSTDAVLCVSGCSLSHLLFMKREDVFIHVLPMGIEKEAETKFGNLAKEIGVEYLSYKIETSEGLIMMVSEEMKAVRIDMNRILSRLTGAFQSIIKRKVEEDSSSLRWNENWLPRRRED